MRNTSMTSKSVQYGSTPPNTMDPLLHAEIDDNKKIFGEKDLDTWVDLVIIVDKRRTHEKDMHRAEAEEAACKMINNDKKCSSSTAGFNDSSCSGTTSTAQSSSTNTPNSTKCYQFFVNYNKDNCKNSFPLLVGYHTLTQADIDNAQNALPNTYLLKFAQPAQLVAATHVPAHEPALAPL